MRSKHLFFDAADGQNLPTEGNFTGLVKFVSLGKCTASFRERLRTIAVWSRTGFPVNSETRAVTMVIPALGPSFGVAPAGKCT